MKERTFNLLLFVAVLWLSGLILWDVMASSGC